MRNLKIGKKLAVTFGIIILLFCLTVILSIVSLRSTQGKFDRFYNEGYQITNYSMDMRRAIQATAKNLGYATMITDMKQSADYIDQAKEELESLTDGVAYMKEHFKGEMSLVDNFDTVMSSVIEQRNQVFELALENKNEEASALYFSDVLPAFVQA